MIRFENEKFGKCAIKFRHTLPTVSVPEQGNSLTSMVRGIRLEKGYTECTLELNVHELGYSDYKFFGVSLTHPNDHYRKETGRLLSLARAIEFALKIGVITEADGRSIWVAYYSRGLKK